MPDVISWAVFQLIFLFLRYHQRRSFGLVFVVHGFVLCLPAAVADRTAFVDVTLSAQGEGDGQAQAQGQGQWLGLAQAKQLARGSVLKLRAAFSNAGSVQGADGVVYSLPQAECGEEDEASLSDRPKDWVALFHYPFRDDSNQTVPEGTNCQSALDRVKRAMMFGASAVIILALNPKIVQELDIAQLFSRPVLVIEEVSNVSALLDAILVKLKMHVKIAFNTTFYDLQAQREYTVIYSRCWRPSPGSGLVCQFEGEEFNKADPGQFWNYFSAVMAILMLLLIIKAKVGESDNGDLDQVEFALRRIALQTVALMKTKRYKTKLPQSNFDDGERDTCAVCLDYFVPKQKIRVLPCMHEFHKKCVDPWLIKQRTCPLCKLNIMDVSASSK